jgi:hypothetical protein
MLRALLASLFFLAAVPSTFARTPQESRAPEVCG